MLIVLIGWGYVVLMMALAEASGPTGSLLGAFVTLMLYGVLPLWVVLYIGGARLRAKARRAQARAPASGDDPGGGGEPAGDAVAPVREEP